VSTTKEAYSHGGKQPAKDDFMDFQAKITRWRALSEEWDQLQSGLDARWFRDTANWGQADWATWERWNAIQDEMFTLVFEITDLVAYGELVVNRK
jgi:hypothetical protein